MYRFSVVPDHAMIASLSNTHTPYVCSRGQVSESKPELEDSEFPGDPGLVLDGFFRAWQQHDGDGFESQQYSTVSIQRNSYAWSGANGKATTPVPATVRLVSGLNRRNEFGTRRPTIYPIR